MFIIFSIIFFSIQKNPFSFLYFLNICILTYLCIHFLCPLYEAPQTVVAHLFFPRRIKTSNCNSVTWVTHNEQHVQLKFGTCALRVVSPTLFFSIWPLWEWSFCLLICCNPLKWPMACLGGYSWAFTILESPPFSPPRCLIDHYQSKQFEASRMGRLTGIRLLGLPHIGKPNFKSSRSATSLFTHFSLPTRQHKISQQSLGFPMAIRGFLQFLNFEFFEFFSSRGTQRMSEICIGLMVRPPPPGWGDVFQPSSSLG